MEEWSGKIHMITVTKAQQQDVKNLTKLMKSTFDREAERWLDDPSVVDYNIQPPGYGSVDMTTYMLEELDYYKIDYNNQLVGGLILTRVGTAFGRVDRIFVNPDFQGKQIGTYVMKWMEETFPTISIWELETSSRQLANHGFYEKLGYQRVFETDEEIHYKKEIADEGRVAMGRGTIDSARKEFYQANVEDAVFYSSNLMRFQASNCNFYQSQFQNINLRESRFTDLNFGGTLFRQVSLGGVVFQDIDLGYENTPIHFERSSLENTTITNSDLRGMTIQNSDITGLTIDGIRIDELVKAYKGSQK